MVCVWGGRAAADCTRHRAQFVSAVYNPRAQRESERERAGAEWVALSTTGGGGVKKQGSDKVVIFLFYSVMSWTEPSTRFLNAHAFTHSCCRRCIQRSHETGGRAWVHLLLLPLHVHEEGKWKLKSSDDRQVSPHVRTVSSPAKLMSSTW